MKKLNIFLLIFSFALFVFPLFAEELIHVLQKGETLYSLSRIYNVPVQSILSFNNILNADKIYAGQKIKIPNTYTVQKGDSLYGVAKQFSIPVSDLMKANSMDNNTLLKTGMVLYIPSVTQKQNDLVTENSSIKTSTPPVSQKESSSSEYISSALSSNTMQDPRSFETIKVDNTIVWPVSALEISYLSGKLYGVSIISTKGEAVKSISSGTVLSAGSYRGFGQVVFIQAKTGYIYVYGGLEGIALKPGQKLSFGDEIGRLGLDSLSGKPQLYFMVYNKNTPIDPLKAPRG